MHFRNHLSLRNCAGYFLGEEHKTYEKNKN